MTSSKSLLHGAAKCKHFAIIIRVNFSHPRKDSCGCEDYYIGRIVIRRLRKNWLFSGSPKGAEASAGIYTMIETAKANGLSPMKYINFILSDIPGTAFLEYSEILDDYLPWNEYVQRICR